MRHFSVLQHLAGQLNPLCRVLDLDPAVPLDLLAGLLGPHGARSLADPPAWLSDIADDHSPVEFSVAFNDHEPPALRILAEVPGIAPGLGSNTQAAYAFLAANADRFGLATTRLDAIRNLFTAASPTSSAPTWPGSAAPTLTKSAATTPGGSFALWCSLVFRHGRDPEFKVYFNPEVAGISRAPELVEEALGTLGLRDAYRMMLARSIRPGELGRRDRLSFFALDLHDGPQARVKLYVSHYDADPADAARAAAVVPGVDPDEVADFCRSAGGPGPFDRRPLVGSYTLAGGAAQPVGYSVYVPIRDYVDDDLEARDRAAALVAHHGFSPALLHRCVAAVSRRPLGAGVGLIAHVSLRLGPPRPGVTVYLSAEAYDVTPPRSVWVPAA
ncbi:tryptophan dimethylallyltransferase family protein [Actinoplanes sp. Pm04-4]|uniref:Tryptophan dimethylallyltransferase family protein n=1 Tax=Paractinoplanes pyxinae TaxID=2997416 RepID=A0ABT4AU00_9ACTN|nr:tryptophan dimethylallyltransferase family protein [Actinoplanes pyxinae]MCY1136813.1 tryptophan dimethylallyltransferase family protein [Actinoplanes pyxinae]